MFDTVGSRMSFPVVAGVAETFRASFWMGSTVGMSVLGATFQAACYVAHGDERGELVAVLPVEHDGSRENAVLVTVPELEHGHYHWELRATDPEGRESRLLYGTLSALNAADAEYVVRLTEESELRELSVQMAAGHAGPLMLRWQSCAAAASLAADAAKAATEARKAAADAKAAAQAAGESETATLNALSAAQAFINSFDKALREAIEVRDNYLYISGVSTGHYLKGEDGVTPSYGSDGYWYIGGKKVGKARGEDGITPHITPDGYWAFGAHKTNVRAAGRDGLNGAAMRRILINSTAELPANEERGVYYYIRRGGEIYDVYVWLEPDGWVCVGEANDIAESDVYGLVKLGTDMLVQNGAPVGTNIYGNMTVPLAQCAAPGVGKLSTDFITLGADIGMDASGAFRTARADAAQHGSVQLSYPETIPATNCIGAQADGCISVVPAGLGRHGVIKAGSVVYELAAEPYRFANGVADATTGEHQGEIVSNLVFGGAIKQMSKYSWLGLSEVDMPWLSPEFATAWPPADTILRIGGIDVVLGKDAGEYGFNSERYLLAWKDAINASSAPVTAEMVMENENPVLTLTAKEDGFAGNEIGLAASSEALRLSGNKFSGGTDGTPPGVARLRIYWTRIPGDAGVHTFAINGREFSMTLVHDANADGEYSWDEQSADNRRIQALADEINAAELPCVAKAENYGSRHLWVLTLEAREAGAGGNDIVVQLLKGGQKGYVHDWLVDGSVVPFTEGTSRNLREGADALPGAHATAEVRVGEDEKSGPWFGLHTSASFTQSHGLGLQLNPATADVLGGVYMAAGIDDNREAAVFSVPDLQNYLEQNYCKAADFYKKTETYSRKEVDFIDTKNRQEAAATYETMAAAKSDHDALSSRIEGCMKKTATVDEICQMTLSEYQALKVRNPKCIYLLTED